MGDIVDFTIPKTKNFHGGDDDHLNLYTCENCDNKTFSIHMDENEKFPHAICAACGQYQGHFGWFNDDEIGRE